MGILLAIHDFVMINVVSCYHGTAGEADVLESLTNGRCAFSLLIFMRLLFFFSACFLFAFVLTLSYVRMINLYSTCFDKTNERLYTEFC